MASYVDLHAHFLPGLDDGAKTQDEGLRMVSALASLGFTTLHATPHQRAGMFLPARDQIDWALAAIQAGARDLHPELAIGVAAENFWDEVLQGRLAADGVPSYPDGKAFLFELNPQLMPPLIDQRLFEIRLSGRLPVLAHPERYLAVQQDPARAEVLGRSAAMLVDLAALDGAHGRPAMKAARRLFEDGLAHAAASDVHTPEDQRGVAAGMAWLRKRMGPAALDRFLDENPRRILTGEIP